MLGIVKAAATTVRAAFRKPVTVEYPAEKKVLPHRARGFPVLLWDFEKDESFCTGCQVCARYCPVDCMTVTMKDNPKFATGESKRKKIVDQFFIDYARCMRCDICVEVCNFDAIVMNNTWEGVELSRYDRQELVMDKDALLRQHRTGHLEDPFREAMGVAHSGWNPVIDEGDIAAHRASDPATARSPEEQARDAAAAAEKKAAEAAASAAARDATPATAATTAAPAATETDEPTTDISEADPGATPPPAAAAAARDESLDATAAATTTETDPAPAATTEPATTPETPKATPPAATKPAEGGEG